MANDEISDVIEAASDAVRELSLDELIEARQAYREGRVRLTAGPELSTPEVKAWLAECDAKILAAIEAELARRTN